MSLSRRLRAAAIAVVAVSVIGCTERPPLVQRAIETCGELRGSTIHEKLDIVGLALASVDEGDQEELAALLVERCLDLLP